MFTSRDLGRFLYSLFNVLEVIGIVAAIVIAIIASVVCYHIKPQWMQKHRWLVPVPALVVLFVFLVIPYFLQKERDAQRQQELQQARAERAAWRKQYYEPAKARFDQLCQNAGEKIYRTADNVDGILLLKVRGDDEKYQSNRYNPRKDQMWEDAAVESESKWEEYVASFLPYFPMCTMTMLMFCKKMARLFVIVVIGTYMTNRLIKRLIQHILPAMPLLMKMIFLGKTANIG